MTTKNLMHDLKPERSDLTPPLPALMMLVPVLFYLSGVAAIGLGALFTIHTRKAQAEEQRELEAEQQERRQIATLQTEQKVIDETSAKATEVVTWMDSTQPMMDVVAAIVSSVSAGHNLSSLRISRASDNPRHMEMRVEINSGGNKQQQEIVQSLIKAGFQTFRDELLSPDKNDRNGAVTYTATLVKNQSSDQ
jgi:hypothetical protein